MEIKTLMNKKKQTLSTRIDADLKNEFILLCNEAELNKAEVLEILIQDFNTKLKEILYVKN